MVQLIFTALAGKEIILIYANLMHGVTTDMLKKGGKEYLVSCIVIAVLLGRISTKPALMRFSYRAWIFSLLIARIFIEYFDFPKN